MLLGLLRQHRAVFLLPWSVAAIRIIAALSSSIAPHDHPLVSFTITGVLFSSLILLTSEIADLQPWLLVSLLWGASEIAQDTHGSVLEASLYIQQRCRYTAVVYIDST